MIKVLFLFVILFTINALPQQFSNWKNYTDMKNVNAISSKDNLVWSATNGGAFLYEHTSSSYTTLTKSNGLGGISLTAVAIDGSDKIWFGSNDGIIDVYNKSNNSFRNILDIFINPGIISKRINELAVSGDTIIVSTDFGISLVDANNYFFFDTFTKFGDLPSNIPVNSTLKTDLVYACTNQGIAIQKPGAINLSAPESWNVYRTTEGLPSNIANKVVSYNNLIIAATRNGLASYNGIVWEQFIPQLNSLNITDLLVNDNSLYILVDSLQVYSYLNNSLTSLFISSSKNLTGLTYLQDTGILASSLNGIVIVNNNSIVLPNGPAANRFPNTVVDNNGVFWSASGTDVSGVGFYKFNGQSWENFNTTNTPQLPSNAFYNIFASRTNKIYLGNWGEGISVYDNGEIKNYKHEMNTPGIPLNPDFIVITDLAEDSRNNLWVLNYGAADRKNLSRTSDFVEWTSYTIPAIGNIYVDECFNLAIDQYDTKWFGCQRYRRGLFYFNERNTAATGDDLSGYLTTSSGLNDDFITSLVVDRRGDLWVGTSLGVNIISNTSTVLSSAPQLRITSVFSLRQQTITQIIVDPLNLKWIGTNQGLTLVNPDGTALLATFDTKNSALLSDNITSLAIDENSGILYVGTDRGLTSFQTSSIRPKETFEELIIYPNPLILNDGSNTATIDGLIRDTDIKILSVSGKLVKQFSSPGGRIAYWDGRDDFGDLVPSGVYFIIAFDKEGNNVEKGKIAVIRK